MAAITLYGLRKGLERLGQEWVSFYTPFAGGVIEVAALFFFWVSLLEAWRRGRSLRREPLLWLGCALALFPPVVEFATYVLRAKP
jgi:hypothetical protein